jgi:hypothetical protein
VHRLFAAHDRAALIAAIRAHLVVRYSKNGLAEQGADLPGELPQLSGWSCHANGSRKGCSQG